MASKFSPQKVTKILRYYFAGVPQREIAKRIAADQSTVSLYTSRFKERVAEVGLLTAGKEFGVFDEVDTLRSLSIELEKAGLIVGDAKQGLNIQKNFLNLGVDSKEHLTLIKVCQKVNNPTFVNAALKLARIEDEHNISYEQIMSEFETVTSRLPITEKELMKTRANLDSINSLVNRKNQELKNLENRIKKLQEVHRAEEIKLERELVNKRKQMKVKHKEVEEVANLKTMLDGIGLNVPTLIHLVKEFKR